MEYNRIIQGHALSVLKSIPEGSVNCVITSPPYWGLRDYGIEPTIWDGKEDCEHEWGNKNITLKHKSGETNPGKEGWFKDRGASDDKGNYFCIKCGAWRGSLGLEPTFELYIKHLCDIFNEAKRVLRKDGTCWVNLGDTYGGGAGRYCPHINELGANKHQIKRKSIGMNKSLCLIPQRFAIEMVNRDTMDIYELDKGYIICNNIDVTYNNNGGKYAIQRSNQSKRIQYRISKEVEEGTQGTISEENERMAREEQRESKPIQQKTLLGSSRTRNNASNERECQEAQEIKNGSNDKIWRKSSEVCLLWGNDLSFFNNRPYQRENEGTQSRSNKMWLNLRMVKENELSSRFQSFMYELQLGNREIWILPPSRGKNLCLRKRDIPIELLPLFKLKEDERWRLRNTIIWHKPNCMPSSAKDRFTVDFEYVYFFVKNKKYWFERVFENYLSNPHGGKFGQGNNDNNFGEADKDRFYGSNGRNKRAVWTIKQDDPIYVLEQLAEKLKIYKEKHNVDLWWLEEEICKLVVDYENKGTTWKISTKPFKEAHFATFPETLIEPMIQAGCPKGGVVLDPFMGAGTTAVEAKKQGKRYLGIEIKQEYIDMAEKRIKKIPETLF